MKMIQVILIDANADGDAAITKYSNRSSREFLQYVWDLTVSIDFPCCYDDLQPIADVDSGCHSGALIYYKSPEASVVGVNKWDTQQRC